LKEERKHFKLARGDYHVHRFVNYNIAVCRLPNKLASHSK